MESDGIMESVQSLERSDILEEMERLLRKLRVWNEGIEWAQRR